MGPPVPIATVRLAVRRVLAKLAAGDLVLVACSGGADSMALAAATAFEAPRAGVRAGAVTVDHGLQPGSAQRAGALCSTLELIGLHPVEAVSVTVEHHGGPEAAARRARYAGLDEAAERLGAAAVLLGHTLEDQAETVLLGLARGSGARSLSGMAEVSGRYLRPLLGVDRATVRAAVADLPVWEDPHNSDTGFARVRARATVLPVLEAAFGPGVASALARTARLLREDADALDSWAATASAQVTDPGDGSQSVQGLADLPAAVRARVLRHALVVAGSPPTDLTAGHVRGVDALVSAWSGQGQLHLPGGVRAERSCGRLRIFRP